MIKNKEINLDNLLDKNIPGTLIITKFKYIPSSIYRRLGKDGYTYLCTKTPYVSMQYRYSEDSSFYHGSIIHNGKTVYTIDATDNHNILRGLMNYMDSYDYNVTITILNQYCVIAQLYDTNNHNNDQIEYFDFK